MALNDSIALDAPILVGQQKATDAKYDNGGEPMGYTSIAQAKSILTIGLRYQGLTIKINGIEYWWEPSDTDLTKDPIIKNLPSATFPDGLISGGEIDVSDFANGNITVSPAQWLLTVSGTQQVYGKSTSTLFTGIGLSSAGNQRYVAFYGDDNNDIFKLEGAESGAAVMPNTPVDTVLIGYTLVTDAAADTPVVDLSGYAKLSGGNSFTGNQILNGELIGRGAFIKTNRRFEFFRKDTDPALPFPLVQANFGLGINDDTDNLEFVRYAGNSGQTVLPIYTVDFLTRIVDFKVSPTVNGSPIGGNPTKSTVSQINTGTDNDSFPTPLGLEGSKYLDRGLAKISGTTAGTSTAYTLTLAPALTSYVTNQPILINVNVASGASPTINVNSLGTKALVRMDGTAIQANDLVTNVRYFFIYDGTSFRLITPIANDNIRNQNTAQQTANFWALIGRLDTGLGLGLAANAASFLTLAANTTAKSQARLTQSTTDVTSPANGDIWNNAGEIKLMAAGSLVRFLKTLGNELFKFVGSLPRVLISNSSGDIYNGGEISEIYVSDTDIIAALTAMSSDRATITPSGSKIMYRSQFYDDGTYTYLAIADNVVRRW